MALETKSDVVLAGGLLRGTEFSPIYVRPETGDVVYEEEEASSVMLIDGLTETQPIGLQTSDAIELTLRNKGLGEKVMGIVYLKDHAVVITSETSAEIRPLHLLTKPSDNVVKIDLDTVDPVSEDEDDNEF